jgi:hypothetical protein
MTFEGQTTCPVCLSDLARDLRDVLRKADDTDVFLIECPKCDSEISITVRIVHHVEIARG